MKAVEPMDEPCEMGFKHRLLNGKYHTFILRCASSHEFLRATHKLQDRSMICHAFARSDSDQFSTALNFASLIVDGARKRRLDSMNDQK
jgi:hypothetical protein